MGHSFGGAHSHAGFIVQPIFRSGWFLCLGDKLLDFYKLTLYFIWYRQKSAQNMIPGTSFVGLLPLFEADEETKAVVLIGEIVGANEEIAAEYIRNHMTKPVVAYIAGRNAHKGRRWGHAGAIVGASGAGSAQSKIEALAAAGGLHRRKLRSYWRTSGKDPEFNHRRGHSNG